MAWLDSNYRAAGGGSPWGRQKAPDTQGAPCCPPWATPQKRAVEAEASAVFRILAPDLGIECLKRPPGFVCERRRLQVFLN